MIKVSREAMRFYVLHCTRKLLIDETRSCAPRLREIKTPASSTSMKMRHGGFYFSDYRPRPRLVGVRPGALPKVATDGMQLRVAREREREVRMMRARAQRAATIIIGVVLHVGRPSASTRPGGGGARGAEI